MCINTRCKRAFALSIVLWISAALILVALYLAETTKKSIVNSSKLVDKLEAQIEAESAFEVLNFYLSTADFSRNIAKNNVLNLNKSIFIDNRAGRFSLHKDSNITYRIQDSGGVVNITMSTQDETINRLAKLFVKNKHIGKTKESMEDWRDINDIQNLNGAEKFYYKSFKNARFEPSNSNFIQHKDEIKLVRGFDKLNSEEWQNVRKYLMFAAGGSLNIYTMDKIMIKSILNTSENNLLELLELKNIDPNKYKEKYLSYLDFYGADMTGTAYAGSFQGTIQANVNEASAVINFEVDIKQNFNKLIKVTEVEYK